MFVESRPPFPPLRPSFPSTFHSPSFFPFPPFFFFVRSLSLRLFNFSNRYDRYGRFEVYLPLVYENQPRVNRDRAICGFELKFSYSVRVVLRNVVGRIISIDRRHSLIIRLHRFIGSTLCSISITV